jgi:hypothetical protein
VKDPRLCSRVDYIIEAQVNAIRGEIARISSRLAELGDSDEDRVEELLLRALLRLLMRDLQELSGFSSTALCGPTAVKSAVVEA